MPRFAAFLLGAAIAGTAVDASAASTLFKDVRVFDGQEVRQQTSVLVVDGLISAVGNVRAPADAVIVDGKGKTLLPGLIDAHVHNFDPSGQREALRFGVTTQLDMFTDKALLPEFKRGRESLTATDLADVFSAGTLVTAPRGHGTQFGLRIPTLAPGADAAAHVNDRVKEGSDFIKLVLEDGAAFGGQLRFGSLDTASLQAAIKAAHENNKLAVVHVSTEADAIRALEAGADGLAHSFYDKAASDEFVKLAKQKNAFVIATLSINASAAGSNVNKALAGDPDLKPYLLPVQANRLAGSLLGLNSMPAALSSSTETVRKLDVAGVAVLVGSDAANPGTTYGVTVHGEMELLVAAGMTPIEALRAATSATAKAFRLADRGRIAPGKRADLLLVEGDPTTRIQATRRIVGIWKNGSQLKREPTPAPVASTAPIAPPGFPISDFEQGKPNGLYGSWLITTDAMRGGKSTAAMNIVDGGAESSNKALRMTGTVAESPIPWSGAMFNPGPQPYAAVNFSGRKQLSFWIRGDGRPYQVMVFS
ncbi:MAG TPA: amidohydrolase family protein, partial [Steroidobacteraceae bacterium]|nr:amidohydrolase family protein [Steroidobacteraceae bacterium]